MRTKYLSLEEVANKFGPLTFGRVLKAHRQADGLTQAKQARVLKLSVKSLRALEHGKVIPSLSRVLFIAKKINLIPELAIQLALQDQLNRASLKMKVTIFQSKNS